MQKATIIFIQPAMQDMSIIICACSAEHLATKTDLGLPILLNS